MSTSTLKAKLIRNLGANAYGQLITIVIQLVSVPLFLHYWGVALYGEWLILSAIPAYLSLSDVGFASVAANDMTMRVARGDKQGALEVYQSIWIFISGVSVLVGTVLALVIFTAPLASIFSITHISATQSQLILVVLMLYVLFGLQSGVFSAAFRAAGRYAYGTVLGNTIRLVEWFGSMVALIVGGDVLIFALVTITVRLLSLIVMWAVLCRQVSWLNLGFKLASTKKIRELVKPAVAFMAFPLSMALSIQGMVLVIGALLGSSSVAIFTAYRTLSRLLIQVAGMLNQAIVPEMSSAYGASNLNTIIKLHRKSSAVIFWFALTSVVGIGLLGNWFIGVWTHHAFTPNLSLLILLLSTSFINVLWQTSGNVLMAVNMHQRISLALIISSVAAILLSIVLIPAMGLQGAALALVLAELQMLYFTINSGLKFLNDTWRAYFKYILLSPLNLNKNHIDSCK